MLCSLITVVFLDGHTEEFGYVCPDQTLSTWVERSSGSGGFISLPSCAFPALGHTRLIPVRLIDHVRETVTERD